MDPLRPRTLTWTALLTRWVEFAKASLALPADAEGQAWRRSVPHIINLQAVTFALGEIGDLAESDRSFACDKASVLIDDAAGELVAVWCEQAMPPLLIELVDDARGALDAAEHLASGG